MRKTQDPLDLDIASCENRRAEKRATEKVVTLVLSSLLGRSKLTEKLRPGARVDVGKIYVQGEKQYVLEHTFVGTVVRLVEVKAAPKEKKL